MCATGSNTIVTDNVFVPKTHTIRMADLREGSGPGGLIHAHPIFRAPVISYAPLTFATPMLGAARGSYEHFREWTKTRKAMNGAAMAETQSIQMRLARTAADLDAGDLLLQRVVDTAQAGAPASLEMRARAMRDCSRVAELAVNAIDTLIAMSGTAGFATAHPLQRTWRDIHFASTHVSVGPERNFTHFGRMELGLPRDPQQMFY